MEHLQVDHVAFRVDHEVLKKHPGTSLPDSIRWRSSPTLSSKTNPNSSADPPTISPFSWSWSSCCRSRNFALLDCWYDGGVVNLLLDCMYSVSLSWNYIVINNLRHDKHDLGRGGGGGMLNVLKEISRGGVHMLESYEQRRYSYVLKVIEKDGIHMIWKL